MMKPEMVTAPGRAPKAFEDIPAEQGFFFPAEWEPQRAMWLSWPHNPDTWPGKFDAIWPAYSEFVRLVAESQMVCINVSGSEMATFAADRLKEAGANPGNITFYEHPTNDAWCRDHGPAFLLNKDRTRKMIVNWDYNAWGDKYPPYDLDRQIPLKVASQLGLECRSVPLVMEGGSVDFNGRGTVLTTTSCLLNPNRNPQYDQQQIEEALRQNYGVTNILWLGDGIVGDDTDGHIDDITRFVDVETVVTVVEEDPKDENYHPLQENLELLKGMRLENGAALKVVELPMPGPLFQEGQRLPASYANFYIANEVVVVPVFNDPNDEKALGILSDCFPGRKVIGVDSTHLVWGLGSFHCLSQQEPAL